MWSVKTVLVVCAVILFAIAFVVSATTFGSHYSAWVSAGLACFAAAFLPWRQTP